VPLMIGVAVVVYVFCLDRVVGRLEGALLFGGILAYVAFAIAQSRRESRQIQAEYEQEFGSRSRFTLRGLATNTGLVVLGLAALARRCCG